MMLNLTSTQYVYVLAGLSGADPRTVRKHLRGKPVSKAVRERIEAAIRLHSLNKDDPTAPA
jgi:DNA-binding LacI/PurR family transcriptional regulator